MKKAILYGSLFFICNASIGQSHTMDSLQLLLKKDKADTNRVIHLVALCKAFYNAGPLDSAMVYANKALWLADKLSYTNGTAQANELLGEINYYKQNYVATIDYYTKAQAQFEKAGNAKEYDVLTGYINAVYINQLDYPRALEFNLEMLKKYQDKGSKPQVALNLYNIGSIYINLGDYPKALDYLTRALAIYTEVKDKEGIGRATIDIGNIYYYQNDTVKAPRYYSQALRLYEELKDSTDIARCISNLGNISLRQNNTDTALKYYNKALKIYESIHDWQGVGLVCCGIGDIFYRLKDYKQAEYYFKYGVEYADYVKDITTLKSLYQSLSSLYQNTGQWQDAYLYHTAYTKLKDSLINQDKLSQIGKLEAKADYDKQLAVQQAEEDKRTALAKSESKRQKTIIIFVAVIALAVVVILLIVFRSLRITRKQKALIEDQKTVLQQQKALVEEQKAMVEEKNREIVDSITYAKRLQDAILPPMSVIVKHLPESFVLYKPKDIVAGDFYWMERLGDTIYIAACDCTGHGVPGAMVSVVCSNALNRAVKEFQEREPGKILDKTRELVLETFEKSEGDIKDGMDISLCSINITTQELKWAGAYNSLWYYENGDIKEIAADKQPIGKNDNPKLFTTHTLSLSRSTLYLFTDGYADQFGGPKGKKFKYRQLSEKLRMISEKSMPEQKQILEQTLEDWKGTLEQVDDILIIGIRV